jgi:hypothetical protein
MPVAPSQQEHTRIIHERATSVAALQGTEQPLTIEEIPQPSPSTSDAGKRTPMLFMAASVLIVSILLIGAVSLLGNQGSTGYVVLGIPQQNITSQNVTIPINQTIIALNISGALYGEGNASVYFDTPQGSLLVGTVTSDDGSPRTDKPSYDPSAPIMIEHAPSDASYYFDDSSTASPVDIPFNTTRNGTLLIVANISGTLATYRLPIIIGDAVGAIAFENLCAQTCDMPPTNGSLRIVTTGNATLGLARVDAAVAAANQCSRTTCIVPAPHRCMPISQYFPLLRQSAAT